MPVCTVWRDEAAIGNAFFFFQAEDGIRDYKVTGVQTCALPISTASALRYRSAPSLSYSTTAVSAGLNFCWNGVTKSGVTKISSFGGWLFLRLYWTTGPFTVASSI